MEQDVIYPEDDPFEQKFAEILTPALVKQFVADMREEEESQKTEAPR